MAADDRPVRDERHGHSGVEKPMSMLSVTREPDVTDRILLGEMARMEHERRMKEIRQMDIEEWASEVS